MRHFRKYAEDVLQRVKPSAGSLVVEIGSNDGSLLQVFKESGLRVLGIDPAREIAQKATESGVETLPLFFTSQLARSIRKEYGPAALIAANNVFAHSDHLGDMADGIRGLLAQDGIFVLEVSYLVDIIQRILFDTIYHEHLCYHSVRPLQSFFKRHGLELIDVTRIPIKGGSLRCTVQRDDGPRAACDSVCSLMDLEAEIGLDGPEALKRYSAKLSERRAELLNLLKEFLARGETLAGYGASITVTTLIYHFGLGGMLEFLVDDNPHKQGLFSPGHHLSVLSPEAIYERQID